MMNILLESLFLIMSVQGNTTAYKELIKTLIKYKVITNIYNIDREKYSRFSKTNSKLR